jgi:hypothetical protein
VVPLTGEDVALLVGEGSTVSLGSLVGAGEVAVGDGGRGDGSSSTPGDGSPQAIKSSNKNVTTRACLRDVDIGGCLPDRLSSKPRGTIPPHRDKGKRECRMQSVPRR